MKTTEFNETKYAEAMCDGEKYVEAILHSQSVKKLVVAGPGTGKSFLFVEICKKNMEQGKNNNLTLTFINELVDDLTKDLHQLSEVKTLHSFALGLIPGDKNMFLDLGNVIEYDYKVITGKEIDFNEVFCNLIEDGENLSFYSKRRKYYNFFSPNCSIYCLLKIFENNEEIIPVYSQILVDEFQDFNKLESKLLDFLSVKSPILIVGDDDQSLYDFKHANPHDMRSKWASEDYESLSLPYCYRCTKVIISAFERMVNKAQSEGFLKNRMPKEYKYFPSEEKDEASSKNQKIIVKRKIYQNSIAYNIDQEIKEIFNPRSKQLPSVLIICPLNKQIEILEKALRGKGFKNIDAPQKNKSNKLMDGFNFLLKDSKSNLGWRIVYQYICEKEEKDGRFKEVLKESFSTGTSFLDLLDVKEREYVKDIVAILRKIKKNKTTNDDEIKRVFDCLGSNLNEIATNKLQEELGQGRMQKNIYKNIPIKITTMLGSKGLTRDYSFLVNFDDKYILDINENGKATVRDGSIYKFLVALTRAKTRTYIFTSEDRLPTFVDWIGDEFYIET